MLALRVPLYVSRCGEAVDPVQCNVDACDKPCELGFWSDWGECSKACNAGIQTRFRDVVVEAGPTGYCPEGDDEDRLGVRYCNDFDCPPDVVVFDKIDMVTEHPPVGEQHKSVVDALVASKDMSMIQHFSKRSETQNEDV